MPEHNNDKGVNSQKQDTGRDLVRLILVMIVAILPFMQSRVDYQHAIEREVYSTRTLMTAEGSRVAKLVSTKIYQTVMFDWKVYQFMRMTLTSQNDDQKDKFAAFWAKFLIVSDRIVENMPLLVFQAAYRLSVAGYWVVYMLPFLCAALYSGVQYWKLTLDTVSGAAIGRYEIYRRMMRWVFLLFFVYLIIPAAGFSSFSRFLLPGALFILGILLNQLVRFYHKMI